MLSFLSKISMRLRLVPQAIGDGPLRHALSLWLLSLLLFMRSPLTNFIYDEQEALLGNPYLNDGSSWLHAFSVDFWGRPVESTIGSYRPLPNLLWKLGAASLRLHSPWWLSQLNLLAHALAALTFGVVATYLTLQGGRWRELGGREIAQQPHSAVQQWRLSFALGFCCLAIFSEAVCAVVGLADVLVGCFSAVALGCIVALGDESLRVKERAVAWLVYVVGAFLGMLSKETFLGSVSALCVVVCAMAWARRSSMLSWIVQSLGAGLGGLLAIFGYWWVRRSYYPTAQNAAADWVARAAGGSWLRRLLELWASPPLPDDAMNNPLVASSLAERLATAAGMFGEQLLQILVPWQLSGDYSFPHQRVFTWGGWAYAGLGLLACMCAVLLWSLIQMRRAKSPNQASAWLTVHTGLWFFLLSYLPLSNSLVLLPTIRAERLLYTPALGLVLCGGAFLRLIWQRSSSAGRERILAVLALYLMLQAGAARYWSLRFSDDVAFWRATSSVTRPSAKSLLNYGIMLGARGQLPRRIELSRQAAQIAPNWAMGQVYLADAYCRSSKLDAAIPYYLRGLRLNPNAKALSALALQCIWEHDAYPKMRPELLAIARNNHGSWLSYLVAELDLHGREHDGIPPEYRPRGYNRRIRP